MLAVLLGYLAGSVPFAFLLARCAGIDVRLAGSGNVGAANVLRTTGVRRGLLVMLLDVAKGAGAIAVAQLSSAGSITVAAAGGAAIVGHIYPVWLKFRGGKGVAVAAGVFALLAPAGTAIASLIFIAVVMATRYVSLGSVAASVALPPAAWLTGASASVVTTAAAAATLIVFRHRANLGRLRAGTERRFGLSA
ncbi:MAG TPA: glycerol-3-phosphate 1-O-acyltransferase PlsY [Vicinamibacterales bacterium]|jgi:glycerol-3-phosphate acyltransferase PlsY|nr:glycerol-3-phosphate 1-O-acyltransferase PlsY [Vicinamibacterales bacterium]